MNRPDTGSTLDRLLKSSAEQIQLPALTDGVASMLLALKYQLDQSQWWTADQLQKMQQKQLKELLDNTGVGVPFYRERLQKAGYHPKRKLTEKIWRRIPILKRVDLQREGTRLGNRFLPKSHGRPSSIRSSGSTGMPVKVMVSELSQYVTNALSLRMPDWHRQDLTGRLAVIRHIPGPSPAAPPHGLQLDYWTDSTKPLYRSGPSFYLDISTALEVQADWLTRVDPHYLLTYPTNLRALVEHFSQRGLELPALQQVQTISESLAPDTRAACWEQWEVPVVDGYSARETGLLALQCPNHTHLHVQSEAVLLEVLDHAGRPCSAGEIGRVIVTILHNFAMPLIRYEIGDYAEVGSPCDCGRGLPVLNRIVGRTRNILRFPDGRTQVPMLGIDRYAAAAGVTIRQAQVVQHALELLELRLVVESTLDAKQEAAVIEVLRTAVGYSFEVNVRYLGNIPRSSSGKYEEFISAL